MQLFKCQHCGQMLFFENQVCARCGHQLGFLPQLSELSALEANADNTVRALGTPGLRWKFCANALWDVCNWLIPADSHEQYCTACRHNRTVPDLTVEANLVAWRKMELAKRRLFYTLLRLRLPTPNRADDPKEGLAFDFLADPASSQGAKVMTGHDEGLVTLAVAEADDAEREARRTAMGEPYRTLLGHFRHEVGHYYWDRLVRDRGRLEESRAMFGDEREDYGDALKRHYATGAPTNWQDNFISTYATAHAWEDFAETWAHYLHIVDGLETAAGFGLEVHPAIAPEQLHVKNTVDPYRAGGFEHLIEIWVPLTLALNAMNRSMGLGDLYPFVVSPPVIRKLSFIHDLVHAGQDARYDRAVTTTAA